MAGEFHYNVRGDAVGEGKADEGLAAGVGANEFVLGIDFIVAVAVAVASDGVGLVEAANLAEVLQAAVHLLVGDVRKRLSCGEVLVLEQTGLRNDGLQQEDIFCGEGINP